MVLQDMETIDPTVLAALAERGITDTERLLAEAGPAARRADLSTSAGIPEATLLALAHRADLMRLPKLVEGYSILLDRLDLGTRAKLATAEAVSLLRALRRTNVELTAVRSIHPESILADWINRAAREPAMVEEHP